MCGQLTRSANTCREAVDRSLTALATERRAVGHEPARKPVSPSCQDGTKHPAQLDDGVKLLGRLGDQLLLIGGGTGES